MSEFKIEHNVPVPNARGKHARWMDLAKSMKPGDSVVLENRLQIMNLRNAIVRLGFKCVCRGVDSGKPRVWLLEKEVKP